MYAEAACHNSRFRGYLKPIFKEARIISLKNDSSNPLKLLWEGVVNIVMEVFTNQRHKQFAAKIPFEGTLEDHDAGILSALGTVIKNAYVSAIKTKIDDSIEFSKDD